MMCDYFQACVQKDYVWFVTAVLRGCEHVAFDRTVDIKNSVFEFFVPSDLQDIFLDLMMFFQAKGYVKHLVQLPNRLLKKR